MHVKSLLNKYEVNNFVNNFDKKSNSRVYEINDSILNIII